MTNFTNVNPNRPATFKQKKAVNARLSSLLAEQTGLKISDFYKGVGRAVTNKLKTHSEVQEYFKITSVSDINQTTLDAINDSLAEVWLEENV